MSEAETVCTAGGTYEVSDDWEISCTTASLLGGLPLISNFNSSASNRMTMHNVKTSLQGFTSLYCFLRLCFAILSPPFLDCNDFAGYAQISDSPAFSLLTGHEQDLPFFLFLVKKLQHLAKAFLIPKSQNVIQNQRQRPSFCQDFRHPQPKGEIDLADRAAAARTAKQWQRDGKIGDLLFVNMALWIGKFMPLDSVYYHLKALNPHSVDIMRYFCGDVEEVHCYAMKAPGEGKIEKYIDF